MSALVPFAAFSELEERWQAARENGIEGLMLKRKDSPYLAGRPKGHWYKWKRAALTIDCVLMYAQRGSGKRSSYYSDYTFGVWKTPDELVPVGKAYSGFTDEELLRLDRWIRNNTVERFGPVRQVAPSLGAGDCLRCRPALVAAQIRRRDALSARPPYPLGQTGAGGRNPRRGQSAIAFIILITAPGRDFALMCRNWA